MSFHFFLKKGILIGKEYGNEEVIGFMGNIIDYISEHGKYTFRHRPLNEVDSLVLCQLVYLNYGPFVKGLMEDGGTGVGMITGIGRITRSCSRQRHSPSGLAPCE